MACKQVFQDYKARNHILQSDGRGHVLPHPTLGKRNISTKQGSVFFLCVMFWKYLFKAEACKNNTLLACLHMVQFRDPQTLRGSTGSNRTHCGGVCSLYLAFRGSLSASSSVFHGRARCQSNRFIIGPQSHFTSVGFGGFSH